MSMLYNPAITGLQSLSMKRETAFISDATNRQVEFALSQDNELLEILVGWGDRDNQRPRDVEQVVFWHRCYDANGLMVPDTQRVMVVPFISGLPTNRYYPLSVMAPKRARKIIFNCPYVNIKILICGRIRFQGIAE